MDGLTHSLVGLTSAKAGLERLSPYATLVSILAANAPDIDVVSGLFGGRWVLLHHHRGITHSIIGTLALGFLIPSIFYLVELVISKWRRLEPRIRYRGLMLASMVMIITHPIMDWTNNYGVRPLLPWSGKWFYGDLVFIVDPYLWLALGGAAFLLTKNGRWKMLGWTVIGVFATLVIFRASAPSMQKGVGPVPVVVVRTIWILGLAIFILARRFQLPRPLGRSLAFAALAFVVCYWGALTWLHQAAYRNAVSVAEQVATEHGEQFLRVAAMPVAANPTRWQCVAETDRAMYRYFVGVGERQPATPDRFEKPTGLERQLVAAGATDARAQALLEFARFPVARAQVDDCVGQTLVQFADLRYTEPVGSRGNFSLNVPVACPEP
jgi:inner membrane protein